MKSVSVVPHDPVWAYLFALERSRVEDVAELWMETVGHTARTAVPGLDTNPVIDLLVGVQHIRDAEHWVRPL